MSGTPRFVAYDRHDAHLGDITGILGAKHTWSVDGTDTLELTLIGAPAYEKGHRIAYIDSMRRVREYEITSPQTRHANGIPLTSLICQSTIRELSKGFITEQRNRSMTAAQALAKALTGTRWTVGDVDATGVKDTSFYHVSPLDAINTICDTYGLEAVASYRLDPSGRFVTGRKVSLLAAQGRSTGVPRRFDYHADLTGITRTVDASNVVTRLYGYGKGVETTDDKGEATGGYSRKISFADVNQGREYVEDATATEQWGVPGPDGTMRPACGIYENGQQDDKSQLLAEARARLARLKTPVVTYEANVLALAQAGMDAHGVDLGDRVEITDTAITPALRLSGRVLKIEENLLDPADTTLTLGNIIETATRSWQSAQQRLDALANSAGAWNDSASLASRYLDDIIDGLNTQLNSTGGYTYLKPGRGIFVYDRPEDQNPTMCIQIGGGYFRIADSKQSNGEWAFRTLGTGRGLVADTIFTGMLHDAASRNWWNLDSGEMHIGNGSITISGPNSTQIRISPQDGFRIYQNGSYVGGLDIDSKGKAYVRSSRTGISSSLYVTTGTTAAGNPGASFVEDGVNYVDVEALTAVDGPKGQTNGVGLAVLNKPFIAASDYYHHVWLFPPTYKDTYMEHPPEQLYLTRNGSVYLQRSATRGLFLNANQAILQFDDKHWVKVDASGVQCRCGSHGFGWLDGKFVDDLTWS